MDFGPNPSRSDLPHEDHNMYYIQFLIVVNPSSNDLYREFLSGVGEAVHESI